LPGVYCNLQQLQCTSYYPKFGELLLNSQYIMLPFGELNRQKEFLFQCLGEEKIFIRPNSGFKIFTGKVVTRDSWDEDLRLFGFYSVEADKLVIASKSQDIFGEWRFVVVDNQIVSGSKYSGVSTLSLTTVSEFAQHAVDTS